MGRPDDRSKHGSVEHPWARAGLESFITLSLWGLYEGPGRKDALEAVTFVLPLLIMAPFLKDDTRRNFSLTHGFDFSCDDILQC